MTVQRTRLTVAISHGVNLGSVIGQQLAQADDGPETEALRALVALKDDGSS